MGVIMATRLKTTDNPVVDNPVVDNQDFQPFEEITPVKSESKCEDCGSKLKVQSNRLLPGTDQYLLVLCKKCRKRYFKSLAKKKYTIRTTGGNHSSFETTIPAEIIMEEAWHREISIPEFLKTNYIEIMYNKNFPGLYYFRFVDKKDDIPSAEPLRNHKHKPIKEALQHDC
jgi:hypothetical protein